VSLEEVRVRLARFVDLHLLLHIKSASASLDPWEICTYHFERVELLLDLLCQDRSQPVACRNVATAVIVRGAPGIVELDARRKCNAFAASRCCRHAPCVGHGRDTGLAEVISVGVVTERSASDGTLLWCARHGGCWAIKDVRHAVAGPDIRRIRR
jgi:hypothetical protein